MRVTYSIIPSFPHSSFLFLQAKHTLDAHNVKFAKGLTHVGPSTGERVVEGSNGTHYGFVIRRRYQLSYRLESELEQSDLMIGIRGDEPHQEFFILFVLGCIGGKVEEVADRATGHDLAVEVGSRIIWEDQLPNTFPDWTYTDLGS
jgi:hypothetical protein